MHNSTACLLAKYLRGRDAPFRKIFCWLRADEAVFEQSDTPGVRHLEWSFPFDAYEAHGADQLAIFADWLVRAVALGGPELSIDDDERNALKERLAAEHYVYTRTDKLKRIAGGPRCEVLYTHTPTELVIRAECELSEGRTIARTLRDHPFVRDELVYGRAISGCSIQDGDRLTLESALGSL
jgi:hypothetical protein